MKLTQLDNNQILKHSFDEDKNALRMHLADGIQLDTSNIESAIKNAFSDIKLPQVPLTMSPSIQKIEVPVIVKEYEIIEKPVIIQEVKVIEVEKPIIIEQLRIVEIEKQIVVIQQQIVEVKVQEFIKQYEPIPSWIKYSVILFLAMSVLTNLIMLFKK